MIVYGQHGIRRMYIYNHDRTWDGSLFTMQYTLEQLLGSVTVRTRKGDFPVGNFTYNVYGKLLIIELAGITEVYDKFLGAVQTKLNKFNITMDIKTIERAYQFAPGVQPTEYKDIRYIDWDSLDNELSHKVLYYYDTDSSSDFSYKQGKVLGFRTNITIHNMHVFFVPIQNGYGDAISDTKVVKVCKQLNQAEHQNWKYYADYGQVLIYVKNKDMINDAIKDLVCGLVDCSKTSQ